MRNFLNAKVVVGISALVVLGLILFFVLSKDDPEVVPVANIPEITYPIKSVIGKSVEGREIEAFKYGNGKTHIVFVGGVHGGYEWNSILLSYEIKDYLDANPGLVPDNVTLTIIPSANPDGMYKIAKKEGRFLATDIPAGTNSIGRFNANAVDLNRNFDCKWQPKSTWQNKTVSAGAKVFSEPESLGIRDFVMSNNPVAVVFWHSQSGAVYASQCEDGILPETLSIMNVFAKASGYKAVPKFDAYQTTGDAESWLAKIGIPSITVELKNHQDTDFKENLAGLQALLKYYADK